jgi:single-strand DNA-binding protein
MARRKSTTTAAEAKKAEQQTEQQEQVTLVGRLCADPVLRKTKSGKAVTNIRIAVNAPDAETTFHSVVVWNRTAEVVCEYLRKGRAVEVVGRPQERTYETADGTERKVIEIMAWRVTFISAKAQAPVAVEKEVA